MFLPIIIIAHVGALRPNPEGSGRHGPSARSSSAFTRRDPVDTQLHRRPRAPMQGGLFRGGPPSRHPRYTTTGTGVLRAHIQMHEVLPARAFLGTPPRRRKPVSGGYSYYFGVVSPAPLLSSCPQTHSCTRPCCFNGVWWLLLEKPHAEKKMIVEEEGECAKKKKNNNCW